MDKKFWKPEAMTERVDLKQCVLGYNPKYKPGAEPVQVISSAVLTRPSKMKKPNQKG